MLRMTCMRGFWHKIYVLGTFQNFQNFHSQKIKSSKKALFGPLYLGSQTCWRKSSFTGRLFRSILVYPIRSWPSYCLDDELWRSKKALFWAQGSQTIEIFQNLNMCQKCQNVENSNIKFFKKLSIDVRRQNFKGLRPISKIWVSPHIGKVPKTYQAWGYLALWHFALSQVAHEYAQGMISM